MATLATRRFRLRDGTQLTVRSIASAEAASVLEHAEAVGGESDSLTFGPGEFGMTVEKEQEYLRHAAEADNQLVIARAIALYERHGFTREGTSRGEIRIDSQYCDVHSMGRWVE